VDVQEESEVAGEVLDEADQAGLSGRLTGAASQVVFHDPSEVGEKSSEELRAPGEQSWKRLGERGDVLPQLLVREHPLDEMDGGRRHPATSTPRTEHPRLARGSNDPIDSARVTAKPDKALVRIAASGHSGQRSASRGGKGAVVTFRERTGVVEVLIDERSEHGHVERKTHANGSAMTVPPDPRGCAVLVTAVDGGLDQARC
jgi:hypothetical protein